MNTKAYRTWIDRIDSGRFTKSECGQWVHAVLPLADDQAPGGFRTNLEPREARDLVQRLECREGVLLDEDHTAQGVNWLHERKVAKEFPEWTREDFSYFSFHGEGLDIGNGYRSAYVPVWRIHGRHGQTLDYAFAGWRSGGYGVEIIREEVPT